VLLILPLLLAACGRAARGSHLILIIDFAEFPEFFVRDTELRFLGLIEATAKAGFRLSHDSIEPDVGVRPQVA
jgi:hypothetical protein